MNNSALRVLDILELFAENAEPLTVSDVSKKLGYPKTSVFDIMNILSDRGYLKHTDERAKTYSLGPSVYQVGMAYLSGNDLYSVSHPILSKLRDSLGETCYLAIEEDGYIIYLDKAESNHPIRSTCNIGAKNSMYLTGLGKAMLAAMPTEKVCEIADRGMPPRTPFTITTKEALLKELEETRARGFALDTGEDNTHVRCVAAPVRGHTGELAAAISVSMLDADFTDETRERAAAEVIRAAERISKELGWRGTHLY